MGDPAKKEIGTPGGYATVRDRKRAEHGQLGIDPVYVEVPTEVRFDLSCESAIIDARESASETFAENERRPFVLAVASANVHMAALVVDLSVRTRTAFLTCSTPDLVSHLSFQHRISIIAMIQPRIALVNFALHWRLSKLHCSRGQGRSLTDQTHTLGLPYCLQHS